MTQPTETEANIRAADDEAGVTDTDDSYTAAKKYMNALARRIAAEREAVPVAWMYYAEDGQEAAQPLKNRLMPNTMGWTERALYAHPPKEPTDAR